jgi:hypothetical protein
VGSGVLVVKAVDICHQEQHIGVDHGGSDSRESIIVTKLDLGNGKSVVFVDNWNDSLFQKCVKGVLGIEISSSLWDY